MNERFTLRAAVHLILIRDGKVLLLRRYQTGWQDGNYSVIAGHLDGDESVSEAMAREALEEGRITLGPREMRVVQVMHRKGKDAEYIDFFLTADAWSGEPQIGEPEKCDELAWYPLDSLPENMVPYIRDAIQTYKSGAFFSEVGWNGDAV